MTSTSIEWTDVTWNPVRGCSRVSEGCRNCYAERVAARFSARLGSTPGRPAPFGGFARMTADGPRWTGKVALVPGKLDEPLRWTKPRRVFVNSMSDLFHESLSDEAIDRVFGVMALTPWHTYQVLTKRPGRMREWFAERWQPALGERVGEDRHYQVLREAESVLLGPRGNEDRFWTEDERHISHAQPWPLPNVWLGVSVEDQATAEERIPLLLRTPAAVRFVSYEPALGPVDFRGWLPSEIPKGGRRGEHSRRTDDRVPPPPTFLDWIIVGGESGPGARSFDVEWARSTIRACRSAGVPVFVKQMGRWIKGDHDGFGVDQWVFSDGSRFVPPIIGPRANARPPGAIAFSIGGKGGDPGFWPEDLRVREFPRA